MFQPSVMALLANYAVVQTFFFLELAASTFSAIQERLKVKSASYISIHKRTPTRMLEIQLTLLW
jgi:hypothetical protein